MGGTIVAAGDSFKRLSENYATLDQCYCVLQNNQIIEDYATRSASRPIEVPNNFIVSTHGDWAYLEAQYIIDCGSQKQLLEIVPYILLVDRTHWVKNRAATVTRHVERQRIVPIDTETVEDAAMFEDTAILEDAAPFTANNNTPRQSSIRDHITTTPSATQHMPILCRTALLKTRRERAKRTIPTCVNDPSQVYTLATGLPPLLYSC